MATLGMFAGFGLAPGYAQGGASGRALLLENLRLFDGESLRLRDDVQILIEGDRISALVPRGDEVQNVERIDCGNRAVIPGLIDAHWHSTLAAVSQLTALTADIGYVHLLAAREAGATLRRGFTTIRDVGGPAFALKRAIDEAVVEGPRIFPSGAMLSQTSGHGDFRQLNELPSAPGTLSYAEKMGVSAIADGADMVLLRAREQLMKGASQLKVMAGGGVASPYDPLDAVQYTERELRAAVEAASDWGTYVCAHVYTSEGIKRSVRAGIKSIEHGQLADEETVKIMADTGVWWSLQPFLADEDSNKYPDVARQDAQKRVAEGTVKAYEWGERYKVDIAFGTDILMNPAGTVTQGRQLAKITRFMSPLEALRMATGRNGELLALSGARAPYPAPLGVIAPGAMADLLVVDGDPETDLAFLGDPENSLRLILKGGQVVKQTL
ncbi:metal-dependent hydrolase family protein [Stappia stellulata]|uniref:metal-dependent hydrolase family protein n=1 Tax=Stappia stellulata TaxID=71235 RepID=UPI0003F9B9E7|nr:amidohydrolase family protein [Stappia stellulata]